MPHKTNASASSIDSNSNNENNIEFSFSHITPLDIEKSVYKLKSNAVGCDNISVRFIKLIMPFILMPLTHIINHSISSSCFPSQWKQASVTPIPKKAQASEPKYFRPISILPCLSKVCENIISDQIFSFLHYHALLSPCQSGFRPNHSCTTAMVKILDDIRIPFDNNHITILCLLDFTKAFDTVDHLILCQKLKNLFCFSNSAVNLINSYLTNRSQLVNVLGRLSQRKHVPCGVPQGSILGPLLFSLFINDIFQVCKYSTMHGYADDLQIYLSGPVAEIDNLCKLMNIDLLAINSWAVKNKLGLNSLKSVVFPICTQPYTSIAIRK